jgi:hypothetical protein
MKKLAISFLTLAVMVAFAASSGTIHLSSNMTAAGTELKAGEYKVMVDGNTATFKIGPKVITVPATTEKSAEKFKFTSMESTGNTVKAIHLAGTDTTIVFAVAPVSGGGL